LAALTLAACNLPQQSNVPTQFVLPQVPSYTQAADSQATAEIPLDSSTITKAAGQSLYRLDVVLDYVDHVLRVNQSIDYFNNSNAALAELLLVSASQYDNSTLTYNSLTRSDGSLVTNTVVDEAGMHVPLLEPLQPGSRFQLNMDFTLLLPQGPGLLAWTERQTNLIDWYPFVPPYVAGSGWLSNPPGLVGEYFAYESADFDVRFQLINAPSGTSIAAPGVASRDGDLWLFSLADARRFVASVSSQYETLQVTADQVPLKVFFFEEHRDAAEASLEIARQSVETFSRTFGPYPYESLTIVEALFADGMESDGMFFLDQYYFLTYDFSPRNYLTLLTAHEVAHNWWFGQVGNDQAKEPWLDEALSTYSELVFYETNYPSHVDWWWQFRINEYGPTGAVDTTIYEVANFRQYVNAVYLRGVQFLHEIREVMGDEDFFAFLKRIVEEGSRRVVTAEEFLWKLAYSTDVVPLRPIMDEYLRLRDDQ
jgi:hypothetical protein